MLLPDQVGTGSDSHTRFPLGISFPAGSGLVAFAAALGVMPIDMPESVLVRFRGDLRPGITLRDLVHAIPFAARRQGQLTASAPAGRTNVFSRPDHRDRWSRASRRGTGLRAVRLHRRAVRCRVHDLPLRGLGGPTSVPMS